MDQNAFYDLLASELSDREKAKRVWSEMENLYSENNSLKEDLKRIKSFLDVEEICGDINASIKARMDGSIESVPQDILNENDIVFVNVDICGDVFRAAWPVPSLGFDFDHYKKKWWPSIVHKMSSKIAFESMKRWREKNENF